MEYSKLISWGLIIIGTLGIYFQWNIKITIASLVLAIISIIFNEQINNLFKK